MTKKELQKKCPKPLQELTLLDRFLFDTAMGDPQICQNVLGIILNEQNFLEFQNRSCFLLRDGV